MELLSPKPRVHRLDSAIIGTRLKRRSDSEVYQLNQEIGQYRPPIESGIAGAHTMEEVKDISIVAATDVFKKLFSIAQLEALAKANQKIHVNSNAHRLNHFSQGTKALSLIQDSPPQILRFQV